MVVEIPVSRKVGEVKREVTVTFDDPESLDVAIQRWGESAVFQCFLGRLHVKVQDPIRFFLAEMDPYDAKKAQEKAQAMADAFVLTTGRTAAVAMSTASFLAFLERKEKAGTSTKEEQALLDFARDHEEFEEDDAEDDQ